MDCSLNRDRIHSLCLPITCTIVGASQEARLDRSLCQLVESFVESTSLGARQYSCLSTFAWSLLEQGRQHYCIQQQAWTYPWYLPTKAYQFTSKRPICLDLVECCHQDCAIVSQACVYVPSYCCLHLLSYSELLAQYLPALVTSVLTRLQTKKKGDRIIYDKFTRNFTLWICLFCLLDKLGGPDTLIRVFDSMQPG